MRAGSPAIGRSLSDLAVRTVTGASAIAVQRAGQVLASPIRVFQLEAGDVLVLLGAQAQVDGALALAEPVATG